MASTNLFLLALMSLSLHLYCSRAQTWIKVGFVDLGGRVSSIGSVSSIRDIDSTLFTHLVWVLNINSSTYRISLTSANEYYFSTFINSVKRRNPSVVTLLSICTNGQDYASALSSMLNQTSYRKSFMESSIETARKYGFQGIDLCWLQPHTATDMTNTGVVLDEWRAKVDSESRNSSLEQLILTMHLYYSPTNELGSVYPVESVRRNVDWGLVWAFDYHRLTKENITRASAALHDPTSNVNTDYGVREWLAKGFPANKLVFGFPCYGYVWQLVNPTNNYIGAPSMGLINTTGYSDLKVAIQTHGSKTIFNTTYVVNHCVIESNWVCFDDEDAVRMKITYAKEMKLRGYFVYQINHDANWVLSRAAAQEDRNKQQPKWRLPVIILTTTATVILVLGLVIYYARRRILNSKGIVGTSKERESKLVNLMAAARDFNSNDPNLQVYSLDEIEAATDKLSFENKLGEGGYGPVYKGVLPNGQEIAVKKLKQASTQGFEEFQNEVMLTAKLQHVNLVRVLGFCIQRDEQMLIYEYMPNKSLNFYLFDPVRRYLLDWQKRIDIIEGVTQGLLYLQEYSRMTIIHRDLKPSNILLDEEMKPKISDFGMARIFTKDEHEANTGRIVGTHGYVPPEYIRKGLYSIKSDIYSFGILLLQIIGGKRTACYYGPDEDLNLIEYAYELWKEGKGMDFMDPSLDDTLSSFKLIRCLQIALLCIQEDANDRPSMLEISSMLKNESAALIVPKQPAFSTRRDEDEENKFPLLLEIYSLNEATISEMEAR